ncbi:MAG: hypothetical protein IPK60_24540 [Sandaracinaceae bacterium]|nr:hypothetical protein [Sandaracinaceae bacterium]
MSNVWVLGAGFSQPLGAPVTANLFSQKTANRMRTEFEGAPGYTDIADVAGYYAQPGADGTVTPSPDSPWSSVEEFLAVVEHAAQARTDDPISRLVSQRLPNADLQKLPKMVRRYLAMACSYFIPRDTAGLANREAWRPYFKWKSRLDAGDTIITFNYDEVVETVCENDINALAPGWTGELDPSRPTLLKLHGSAGWARTSKDVQAVGAREVVRLDLDPLIGVPGPSKPLVAKHCADLWGLASTALSKAESVIIVGYRFAETDDDAKAHILGALNKNASEPLTVRIALGPDVNHVDVRRVSGLCEWALRARRPRLLDQVGSSRDAVLADAKTPVIDAVPMFSQDFIALAERWQLSHWRPRVGAAR